MTLAMGARPVATMIAWDAGLPSLPAAQVIGYERMAALRLLEKATASMASALGLPTPTLVVENGEAINALLLTYRTGEAAIVLSTGLVDRLRTSEACAVIAHELAHLLHRDPGFPVDGGVSGFRSWWHSKVWVWRNRHREFRADAVAAAMVGRDALIGALRKSAVAQKSFGLRTHPSPAARIRKIERAGDQAARTWNRADACALTT